MHLLIQHQQPFKLSHHAKSMKEIMNHPLLTPPISSHNTSAFSSTNSLLAKTKKPITTNVDMSDNCSTATVQSSGSKSSHQKNTNTTIYTTNTLTQVETSHSHLNTSLKKPKTSNSKNDIQP